MDDTLSLAGRAAIVTGAGNGLGRAEALALAAAGARLVLNDLAGDDVHAVADEITAAGGQAAVCAGDIGEWATGEQLVAAALEHHGQLDILVNNAGVLRDRMIFSMSVASARVSSPMKPAEVAASPKAGLSASACTPG